MRGDCFFVLNNNNSSEELAEKRVLPAVIFSGHCPKIIIPVQDGNKVTLHRMSTRKNLYRLQFSTTQQLSDYLHDTNLGYLQVDYQRLTLDCLLEERDVELATNGFSAGASLLKDIEGMK